MESNNTIPLSNIKWLFSAAELNGVDKSTLLSMLGVLPEQYNDAYLAVSVDKANAVRDFVKSDYPNPAIALILGEKISFGEFGVLDYISSSSPTLYVSYTKLQKYFNILIHPSLKFKFNVEDDQACLELELNSDVASSVEWYVRECIEYTFSLILNRIRAKTGFNSIPTKLYLKHAKPGYFNEYRRIFNCDIVFDAAFNKMYFEAELMNLKQIYTQDSKLHELISSIAESALKNIPTSTEIEDKVLQILKEEIKNGKPSINLVADKLFISRQTLHRKLVNNGTSYSDLIDNFRKNMAQTYLRDSSMTIDEISFLLGYSNTSSFHRSFKRLTGASPSSYRI